MALTWMSGANAFARPRFTAIKAAFETLYGRYACQINSPATSAMLMILPAPRARMRRVVARVWNCTGNLPDGAFRFLSFADDFWTNIPQFSMGHFAGRDWLPVNFPRALAASAKAWTRTAGFARRSVFTQAASFQIDGDVGRGEAYQRR